MLDYQGSTAYEHWIISYAQFTIDMPMFLIYTLRRSARHLRRQVQKCHAQAGTILLKQTHTQFKHKYNLATTFEIQ